MLGFHCYLSFRTQSRCLRFSKPVDLLFPISSLHLPYHYLFPSHVVQCIHFRSAMIVIPINSSMYVNVSVSYISNLIYNGVESRCGVKNHCEFIILLSVERFSIRSSSNAVQSALLSALVDFSLSKIYN